MMPPELWMLIGGLIIALCAGMAGFICGMVKASYEFAKIFFKPMG